MDLPLGLYYQNDFLSPELEQEIVSYLDKQPWSTKLTRRTQHYGYEYDYKSRKAPLSATPISGPLRTVADHLAKYEVLNPTQCIVNEYTQKQGISAHSDSNIFGPVIVSISLLAPCEMIFTKDTEEKRITLLPRSALIMTNEARSLWKHEIRSTLKVPLPDKSTYIKPADYRRISLTFRTLR